MNIARPSTGFNVSYQDSAKYELARLQSDGSFGPTGWNLVTHILKWNGHKLGRLASELGAGVRSIRVFEICPAAPPDLHISYLVLGDQVYVQQVVRE